LGYSFGIDAKPSLDLLLDHTRVRLYCEWIHRYYEKGSTSRNTCIHLAGLLDYLEGVKQVANQGNNLPNLKLCSAIFKEHAQTAKVKAIRQRATLANDEEHFH